MPCTAPAATARRRLRRSHHPEAQRAGKTAVMSAEIVIAGGRDPRAVSVAERDPSIFKETIFPGRILGEPDTVRARGRGEPSSSASADPSGSTSAPSRACPVPALPIRPVAVRRRTRKTRRGARGQLQFALLRRRPVEARRRGLEHPRMLDSRRFSVRRRRSAPELRRPPTPLEVTPIRL